MDHPSRRTVGLALAIVASLAAAPGQAAADAPAAGDEYVLELPGVRQSESSAIGGGEGTGPVPRTGSNQLGVVGEADAPGSPLDTSADAAGAVPAPLLGGLAGLMALALAAVPLRRRETTRRP